MLEGMGASIRIVHVNGWYTCNQIGKWWVFFHFLSLSAPWSNKISLGGGVVVTVVELMLKVKEIKTVTLTLLNMSLLKGVLKDYPKLPWGLVHHGECQEAMTGIWDTCVLCSLSLKPSQSTLSLVENSLVSVL